MCDLSIVDGALHTDTVFEDLEKIEQVNFILDSEKWYNSHADAAIMRVDGKKSFNIKLQVLMGFGETMTRLPVRFEKSPKILQDLWLDKKVSANFLVTNYNKNADDLEEALDDAIVKSPSGAKYWLEDTCFFTDFKLDGATYQERIDEAIVAKKWFSKDFSANAAWGKGEVIKTREVTSRLLLTGSELRAAIKLYNKGSKKVIAAYFKGYITQSQVAQITKENKKEQNIVLTEILGSEKAGTSGDDNIDADGELLEDNDDFANSGKALATNSDKNGAYFETRVYRCNAKTTARNLRNEFGEAGEKELKLVIKNLVTMITNKHKYKPMDSYSQFNLMIGVSDGEVDDIGRAIIEDGMLHDEVAAIFGHTHRTILRCVEVFKEQNNG